MLSLPVGLGVALLGLGGLLGSVPLAAQPGPAPARPGGAAIAVQADISAADSSAAELSGSQLAARVAGLLEEWYGQYVTAWPVGAGADRAEGAAWLLRLAATAGAHGVQLRSELTNPGGAAATRDAWLPPGSPDALAATAAADAFWLWAQARQFPYLSELAPAPVRSATLAPHALSRLDQRPAAAGLLAAAAYPGGMLALSPAGPLALGPRFELTPDTMLWLTWRDPGAPERWHGLHPLADGRVVLQPEAGPARLVDPHHDRSTPLPAAPAAVIRSAGGPPPALLAVTPSGTAVWHRPGLLATQHAAGGAVAAAVLELPPGSIAPAAVTGDDQGAVWAFDPRERRIRVFGSGNGAELRQLFAVTPLLPREELAGVQTLALTGAGHLLVGSRRAIWKLDRRGLPVWSLRLLRTRPRQRLPQAFAVTARERHEDGAAFLLLDRTTGALHRFIEFIEQPEAAPAPEPPPLLLRAAGATPPGALAAAATDNALRAAQRAWQQDYAGAAQRLLAAARRSLSRWRAADPLARDADQRAAAIESLAAAVEQALYGEPGAAGD